MSVKGGGQSVRGKKECGEVVRLRVEGSDSGSNGDGDG